MKAAVSQRGKGHPAKPCGPSRCAEAPADFLRRNHGIGQAPGLLPHLRLKLCANLILVNNCIRADFCTAARAVNFCNLGRVSAVAVDNYLGLNLVPIMKARQGIPRQRQRVAQRSVRAHLPAAELGPADGPRQGAAACFDHLFNGGAGALLLLLHTVQQNRVA